jgi:2-octaprenyl-6-methoxyphenol hydroxylase
LSVRCDVLVAGGGLAGLSLACALGKEGLEVVVLEPARAGTASSGAARSGAPAGPASPAGRPIALARGSARILAGIVPGAWEALEAEAAPITAIHVSQAGGPGVARIRASDHGVPALGHVVAAARLEAALAAAAAAAPGVRVRPAVLERISLGSDRVRVLAAADGDALEIEAALVVAADGGESRVREQCGIEVVRRDYRQQARVAEVGSELPPRGWAFERFTAGGPLALLPLAGDPGPGGGGRMAVVWTMPPEDARRLADAPPEAFLGALERCFGARLGVLREVAGRADSPLVLIASRRAGGGRAGRRR